ncbi:hypothetical protein OIU76_029782 [Salix suchowensis]|nr:hypothetical protein OIU76_029782 [Salix suchowensis]
MIKPRPPISTPEQERNITYRRNWDQQSIAVEEQDNTRARSQTITVIKPVSPESQSQRQLRSQQCRPQQQESSSVTYKQRIQTQNEMFISRDRTPPRAKLNNLLSRRASSAAYGINEARDSVALNRNIISRGRTRASNLAENSTIDKDRKVRKRTVGFNAQGGLNERSHQIDKNTSHQRRLVLDENDGKTPLQNRFPLRGGALGTILEQKLKELASQEQEELTSGGSHPMRSAAMILQELIFALTEDQPMSPHAHMFNADKTYQLVKKVAKFDFVEEGKIRRNSVGISADGAHLSPGSVLEASFSNDSCLSSSLDDSSGCRMLLDSMDCSYDQPQPVDTDADLLDCASSLIQGRTGSKMATDLLNHVSRILQSINLAGVGLAGNKLTHAKEVILNAELLFGSATLSHSDRTKRFLVGPFLLDGLETLAGAMPKKILTAILDLKRTRAINSESFFLTRSERKSEGGQTFAGMIPDEIIDWEMSHSLGKWTDFEIEGFETGAEIDRDILQTLVEEIAVDLLECRVDSI